MPNHQSLVGKCKGYVNEKFLCGPQEGLFTLDIREQSAVGHQLCII